MNWQQLTQLCTTSIEIEVEPIKEILNINKPLRLDFGVWPAPECTSYMHWYWQPSQNLKGWSDRLLQYEEIDPAIHTEIRNWLNERDDHQYH